MIRKTFEIQGTDPRICEYSIYSNSEWSEKFLKQNAFLTYSWRFLRSNIVLEKLEFKSERKNWDLKTCKKLDFFSHFFSHTFLNNLNFN